MNRIGIVGIDWRKRGPERIAQYTIPTDERASRLLELQERIGTRELVYLATCNRVELVFVTPQAETVALFRSRIFSALRGRPPRPREAEVELAAWGGEGAAEHLFLLASGLESAMLGEREIVGQMRTALELARSVGTSGRILEWVFDEAFKVGKRVHRITSIGEGKVSIGELALAHVRDRLGRAPGAVALVGVSPMTLHCARALVEEQVPTLVFNRSPNKAREMADELGIEGHGLDRLRRGLDIELAAVVLATAAPEPVLRRSALERLAAGGRGHSPLIVDLATPADVDPEEARLVGLERIGMEQILEEAAIHRRGRTQAAEGARDLVDHALVDLDAKLVDRVLAPMLAALQRRYRTTAERGVDRLLRKELGDVDEAAERAIRRWAEVLAHRFAHIPSTGLRTVAKKHGFEVLESFFAGADDALAGELARIRSAQDRPLPGGLDAEPSRSLPEVLG